MSWLLAFYAFLGVCVWMGLGLGLCLGLSLNLGWGMSGAKIISARGWDRWQKSDVKDE